MSRDGYLPDDVQESDLPGEDDQHYLKCPAHEDAPEVYSECGGIGECLCSPVTREVVGCGAVAPECKCADIFESLEADREP